MPRPIGRFCALHPGEVLCTDPTKVTYAMPMQEDAPTNADSRLREMATGVEQEGKDAGIGDLVGGLAAVIISTEPGRLMRAVGELLATTGYEDGEGFRDEECLRAAVLRCPGSADMVLQARPAPHPAFAALNTAPRARALPSTRLETLVFPVRDLEDYMAIQRKRGVRFLSPEIVTADRYRFIQTYPSRFTGNSLGFIEWEKGVRGIYRPDHAGPLELPEKPEHPHLQRIGPLDHAATRVRAGDRDPAILEFLSLTGYRFSFAVPVESQNSLTSVTRRNPEDCAMVFTSGLSPFRDEETSGPTETFIHRYGPRVHHLAFRTEEIRNTVTALERDGLGFLDGMAGSEEEGIHQIFTRPSPHTMLVTEYLHRYGEFDGFFTEGNVTRLTAATARQD